MSYVGKGLEAQVLTMVSGLIRYAVSTGAGGSLGVTVAALPTVADFETLSAAATAGNSIMNVIGDVNEVANVDIPSSGITVNVFNAAQVDMGTNKFLWASDANAEVKGNGHIRYAFAASGVLFDFAGNNGRLTVAGMELRNNSTADATLTEGLKGRFDHCVFDGEARLGGERNIMDACEVNTLLVIASGAINNIISNTHLNIAPVDFGSGTLFSDILIY